MKTDREWCMQWPVLPGGRPPFDRPTNSCLAGLPLPSTKVGARAPFPARLADLPSVLYSEYSTRLTGMLRLNRAPADRTALAFAGPTLPPSHPTVQCCVRRHRGFGLYLKPPKTRLAQRQGRLVLCVWRSWFTAPVTTTLARASLHGNVCIPPTICPFDLFGSASIASLSHAARNLPLDPCQAMQRLAPEVTR